MFGVGMHFSVGDLMAVRSIALPGAIVQIKEMAASRGVDFQTVVRSII